MRKSQADIAGIALAVILAVFAVLFFVKNSGNEDLLVFDDQINSKISSKFILTLLDTTADCNNMNLEEILLFCAEGKNLPCADACQNFEEITQDIFSKTFDRWNKAYYFTVTGDLEIMEFGVECSEGQISSSLSLPSKSGLLSLKLDICS
jgi:hypothetical protein